MNREITSSDLWRMEDVKTESLFLSKIKEDNIIIYKIIIMILRIPLSFPPRIQDFLINIKLSLTPTLLEDKWFFTTVCKWENIMNS